MKILVGLDRDGTINEDFGYFGQDPNWRDQLKIIKNVEEGIRLLNKIPNSKTVVCTNQAGVARGLFTVKRVKEINKTIHETLKKQGAIIDGWYFSPFVNEEYAKKRNLSKDNPWINESDTTRKPDVGMLRQAAKDLNLNWEDSKVFYIGDKASDVKTALNANGVGIKLSGEPEEEEKTKALLPNPNIYFAKDLLGAAKIITQIASSKNLSFQTRF